MKRLISFVMSLILMISLVPSAAGDYNSNATGSEITAGGQYSGSFNTNQQGYRIYIVDANGNRVSRTVDIVFSDPKDKCGTKTADYYISTKFDGDAGNLYSACFGVNDIYLSDNYAIFTKDYISGLGVDTRYIPYAIEWNDAAGAYEGKGTQFREWFMHNAEHFSSTGPIYSNNNGILGSRIQGKPSPTPTPNPADTSLAALNSAFRNSVNDAFKLFREAGYSRTECINNAILSNVTYLRREYIAAFGNSEGNAFFEQTMREITDDLERSTRDFPNTVDIRTALKSNATYFINGASTKQEAYSNLLSWLNRNSSYKGLDSTTKDEVYAYGKSKIDAQYSNKKASVQNSLFSIAYADDTTKPDKADKDGQIYKVMLMIFKDEYVFQLNLSDADYPKNVDTGEKLSPLDATIAIGGHVMVEPVFWFRPATSAKDPETGKAVAGRRHSRYFYGTPTDYGRFIIATGGFPSSTGGHYANTINKTAAHCMFLQRPLVFENGKTVDTVANKDTGTQITASRLVNSTFDYAIHEYSGDTASSTHTWDNVNYPDPSGFKEHPAPDPKLDPPTKDQVEQLKDHLHYRVVKVYDKEVIDTNGGKSVVHVSTHIREETLPIIEIQDELEAGKYKVVNWKYSDEYFGCTEGANGVGTAWTDQPIASITGSLIVEQGTSPATVNIQDPSDPEKERTLYVELRKERDSTTTWDEPNHPEGDPAPAPEPPKSDDPNNPYTVQIVKTYRIKKLDGSYQYVGTYLRERNPGLIQVDDEPEYRLKEWFISKDTIPSVTTKNWEQITSQAAKTGESGTSEKKVDVLSPNKAIYSPTVST